MPVGENIEPPLEEVILELGQPAQESSAPSGNATVSFEKRVTLSIRKRTEPWRNRPMITPKDQT